MRKGFYLLCDLGVSIHGHRISSSPQHLEHHLHKIGATVRSVYLSEAKRITPQTKFDNNAARFGIWLEESRRDEKYAQRIADAIMATHTFLSQSIAFDYSSEVPWTLWIPQKCLRNNYFLKLSDIERLHDPDWFNKPRLGRYFTGDPNTFNNKLWNLLPAAMKEDIFEALHFLQASLREFCFSACDLPELIRDRKRQPFSRVEFVRAEIAAHNSYKAIEAIIGDPSTDDRKLQTKLRDVGMDPNELVGFRVVRGNLRGKEPLWRHIRFLNHLRDKKVAHGRTNEDRRITYNQILDFQSCARFVIWKAMDNALGTKNIQIQ